MIHLVWIVVSFIWIIDTRVSFMTFHGFWLVSPKSFISSYKTWAMWSKVYTSSPTIAFTLIGRVANINTLLIRVCHAYFQIRVWHVSQYTHLFYLHVIGMILVCNFTYIAQSYYDDRTCVGSLIVSMLVKVMNLCLLQF